MDLGSVYQNGANMRYVNNTFMSISASDDPKSENLIWNDLYSYLFLKNEIKSYFLVLLA